MTAQRPAIEIVPVGDVPPAVLRAVVAILEERFPGRRARLATQGLPHPQDVYVATRRQYWSEPVLDRLAALPSDAERLLGVADLDLFAGGLNFIFGQAQVGGRAAVIALARLHPEFWGQPADPTLFRERVAKEAVHELGHTYGLPHCGDPQCVMHFSNTLRATDRKRDQFCGAHARQLNRQLRL